MMTDKTWEEFCELYFDEAKRLADIHIAKHCEKNGAPNKRVDLAYVKDAAVLAALEKTYAHFDNTRGANILTFLSRVVHNEVIDELTRQSNQAAKEQGIDDLKTTILSSADDFPRDNKQLILRLRAAIDKLSPSDQIILYNYLEDKKTYIARSVQQLGTTEGYVSLRRFQIFQRLPRLMEMTREQYLRYQEEAYEARPGMVFEMMVRSENMSCKRIEPGALSSGGFAAGGSKSVNPIQPSLDLDALALSLMKELL